MMTRGLERPPVSGDADDNLTWSHPRVLSILLVVFLLGTTVGATATSLYLHRHMVHTQDRGALRLANLKSQLHLTPQQEVIVTRELDDYAKYYQNIEEERHDVAQHGRQRIMAVLTPDQQRRFAELFDPITR